MLMPGRSLDTTGLCVTATRYYVKQEMHYANAGTLGTGGGGGAVANGADTLSNLGSSGVSAHGLSGGLTYTITGLPSNFISLDLYFSYLSGTATVSLYKGTNTGTSGILLKSVTASYTSPAVSLFLAPVTMVIGSTVTVVITMPSGSSRSLFSIDSMRYGWWSNTDVPYLFAQCGNPVDKYEFGFNGQMKVNEIAGVGNWTTAEGWEYNTRTGIRANRDKEFAKKPNQSPYATNSGNPIWYCDPSGNLESVHTDDKGTVLANYYDGDNSVYMHTNEKTTEDVNKKYVSTDGTSAGGQKIGELGGTIDATTILGNTLADNKKEVYSGLFNMTPLGWYNRVKFGGKWDYKDNMKTVYGVAWAYDIKAMDKNKSAQHTNFYFKGLGIGGKLDAADIGNYNAGYTGSHVGIYTIIQKIGAGVVEQLKQGNTMNLNPADCIPYYMFSRPPYGDMMRDYLFNKRGVSDAQNEIDNAPKPTFFK